MLRGGLWIADTCVIALGERQSAMTVTVQDQSKPSRFLSFGPQLICDLNLSTIIGKNEAILLQQLYYWLNHSFGEDIFGDGRKWIYNTYEDWAKQLGCSASTVRRAVKNLEDLRIVLSCKPEKSDGYHRKSYTINFDTLSNYSNNTYLISEQIACVQNEQIIIETDNTCISSITSGEEVSSKPVKQPPVKSPRKEKISKPEGKESRLTEANQTVYKLVEIYQKQIGEKVILNKRLGQWLMAAFQKLGSCLKKWENFCKRIVTSDWIMGRVTEGFKASLSWLLRFEVMDRVLAGGYKCKEPYEEAPIPTQEDEQDIIKQIENSGLSFEEQSVKKTLLKTFGVARFKSYFGQAKVKLEQEKVSILVKSLFYRDQIDTPTIWGKITALYPNAILGVES